MNKTGIMLFLMLFLCACAETKDGTFVMNEETIENFFDDKDGKKSWNPPAQLNLLKTQTVVPADIPPVPRGLIRIDGTMTSAGTYEINSGENYPGANARGSTFSKSVFGLLGEAGKGGNAWFYADINPKTREIITARAYLYNFKDGVCDLRQSLAGSFGELSPTGFTLSFAGYCEFPNTPGSMAKYAILIEGAANPLTAPEGFVIPGRYIMDNSGKIGVIPANPAQNPQIDDYGQVQAWIAR